MLAAGHFRQTLVAGVHRRGASDMGRRQSEDAVAVASAAEKQGDGTLALGFLEGRDGEAEGRHEGMGELGDDPVDEGLEGLQLGANTREARLPFPDSNLNLREASLIKDSVLDMVGSALGIVEGDRVGLHTDSHEERAEGFLGPLVSPTEAHDGGERHLALAEVCLHILEDPGPGVSDGMVVDRVELTKERLRLRTAPRRGPARTRLVEERRPADGSAGVGERVGVVRYNVCPSSRVDAELVKLGGSRRDKCWGWGDRRLDVRLRSLSDSDERVLLEGGRFDIGGFNRHWTGTVSNEDRDRSN